MSTLCDPMDCTLPGSSVHRILQAGILEWVAIPFSRGSSQPENQTQVSCIAGRFFTIWAIREALHIGSCIKSLVILDSTHMCKSEKRAVNLYLYLRVILKSYWKAPCSSVQFDSVSLSCPTLWDPMDCNTSGFPVYHQLPEPAQTHVHWVGHAIQPSHLLSSFSSSVPSSFFCSVQFSCSVVSESLWPHELQHTRPPGPSPTPGVHPKSCASSQWCHPAISSSVVPSPPAPNLFQHQSLFQWVNSSHEVAKVLEFQPQHQSFQWTPRTGLL